MTAKEPEYLEMSRYVVLSTSKSASTGKKVLVVGSTMTIQPPVNPSGVVMKVTFRVPRALFEPFEAQITVGEDQVLGSPKAIVADLKSLREELG